MATIKSYTNIEQSKKLEEILPLESADYFHAPDAGIVVTEPYKLNEDDETVITAYKGAIPCWSLAALLELMPHKIKEDEELLIYKTVYKDKMMWEISYDYQNIGAKLSPSLLIAIYSMVCWLLQNNYIKTE